jgi:hypothetical protein
MIARTSRRGCHGCGPGEGASFVPLDELCSCSLGQSDLILARSRLSSGSRSVVLTCDYADSSTQPNRGPRVDSCPVRSSRPDTCLSGRGSDVPEVASLWVGRAHPLIGIEVTLSTVRRPGSRTTSGANRVPKPEEGVAVPQGVPYGTAKHFQPTVLPALTIALNRSRSTAR